ncbi:MAG: glycosyltransferase family 4 protein [Ignavibacteria bacterium]|nr:glycosyltransferase family 4 protein [Ignavibacteria bacterium]
MNYCFLVTLDGFGGLELQTIQRAFDTQKLGNNALAIVKKGTKAELFAKELGLEYKSLTSNFYKFNPLVLPKISKLFTNFQAQICIVPKTNLLLLALLSKKLSKQKLAVIFFQQMQSGIIKKDLYHNWIYKNLDGAIVLTQKMKEMLLETTIIDKEKVFVVPYGIKWTEFVNYKQSKKENRQHFNLPENAFIIGCVGRIDPKKGQETLLDSFIRLSSTDTFLVFAGSIESYSYYKSLIKKVKSSNVENRVKFITFTKEVPKLMNAFDVFVLPSSSETFGLVILEAMASELPVIATNSGGVPEIIENGKDGLLFEPDDSENLRFLLEKIKADSSFANFLGKNALEKVKNKFDYQKNVNMFFEVCEKIYNRL